MRRRSRAAWFGLVAVVAACASTTDATAPGVPDVEPSGADASIDPPSTRDAAIETRDAASIAVEDGAVPDSSVEASAPPTPTDGIQNGTETGIDCGGPDPTIKRCPMYETCLTTADCAVGTCMQGAGIAHCQTTPSCTGALGTRTCGMQGNEDCCTSLPVPAGTVQRWGVWNNTAAHTTVVGGFKLDKFEITVGRMRAFFEAMGGNLRANAPAPGAGAHPRIPNSGWRASFNARLPASWAEVNGRFGPNGCFVAGDNTDGGTNTWTPATGPYEELPMVCADWYTLFAFCIWDGGRLPTDAEWVYASSGGEEGRDYAWGKHTEALVWPTHKDLLVTSLIDPNDSLYRFTVGTPFRLTDPYGRFIDGPAHIGRPGSKTGNGRWGHADLTGNVLEWMLDVSPVPERECTSDADCANVTFPDPPQDQTSSYPGDWRYGDPSDPNVVYPDGYRSLRGGSYDATHPLYNWYYYHYRVARTYGAAGARCARD